MCGVDYVEMKINIKIENLTEDQVKEMRNWIP